MGWYEERFEENPSRYKCACGECGVHMWLPKSKLQDFKNCSIDCARKANERRIDSRSRNCKTCGKKFIPRPRQLRIGIGMYCSQKCNTSSHKAMNSKEAQKIARERWKEKHRISPIVKYGPENARWNGGLKAKKERERLAGWPSQAARRAKSKTKFSAEFLNKLCILQQWKCACCCASIRKKKHLDHIVPLSKGGKHEEFNVQFLCPKCNLKKHAKDPIQFMQEQGFLL